jgi:uncharacterized protein
VRGVRCRADGRHALYSQPAIGSGSPRAALLCSKSGTPTAALPCFSKVQQLLNDFYAALRMLSTEELSRLTTPDFVLNWQGTRAIPWAGEWAGSEGLVRFVRALNANVEILSVTPLHTLHGAECSVVVLEGHWRLPATGIEVRAQAANIFTFAGGRIASYTVLNNSAAFALALAGAHPVSGDVA